MRKVSSSAGGTCAPTLMTGVCTMSFIAAPDQKLQKGQLYADTGRAAYLGEAHRLTDDLLGP